MRPTIKLVGLKPVPSCRNGLIGFCDLAFKGIVILGLAIRRTGEAELRPGLPPNPPSENSKDKRWQPIVSFRKDSRDELQREIIRQVEVLQRGAS